VICEEHEHEILEIANAIAEVCAGRNSACVYAAISLMIGGAAAAAPKPDFDGCLNLIRRAALDEFTRRGGIVQ
jgi:hypothetical protein